MLTYVLILTIWATGGAPEVYVLDSAMTGADCIERLEESYRPEMAGVLSCEVDEA